MYDFNFQSASSIDDAAARLSAAEDGTVMAGGQTLIPVLKQRLAKPSDVISLAGAGLSGITNNGDSVTIGAMTTHSEVAASTDVPAVLRSVAKGIGDAQVRNRGTLGGSLANNDPAADYPAAALGLGATITTNQRDIAADDFFTGMFETVLEPDELITSVSFPIPDAAHYMKFPNPASRYALVGVMVVRTGAEVRVAVTGAGSSVFRVAEMEAALESNFDAAAIENIVIPEEGLNNDIHASADYRAHLVSVMTSRAVSACS